MHKSNIIAMCLGFVYLYLFLVVCHLHQYLEVDAEQSVFHDRTIKVTVLYSYCIEVKHVFQCVQLNYQKSLFKYKKCPIYGKCLQLKVKRINYYLE